MGALKGENVSEDLNSRRLLFKATNQATNQPIGKGVQLVRSCGSAVSRQIEERDVVVRVSRVGSPGSQLSLASGLECHEFQWKRLRLRVHFIRLSLREGNG